MPNESETSSAERLVIDIPATPVSVNQQYEPTKNGGQRLALDARIYRELVGWEAKMAARRQKWKYAETGKVRATAIYFMPANRRQDVNNDKLTWDAMEGIVYKNDRQLFDQRNLKVYTKDYQRTVVILEKINDEDHEQYIQEVLEIIEPAHARRAGAQGPGEAGTAPAGVRREPGVGGGSALPEGE